MENTMGTLHIEHVKDSLIHNYEYVYTNTPVDVQHQFTQFLEEIITLWTQSQLEAQKNKTIKHETKWLKVGKSRTIDLPSPVALTGKGLTALEMVQKGRT